MSPSADGDWMLVMPAGRIKPRDARPPFIVEVQHDGQFGPWDYDIVVVCIAEHRYLDSVLIFFAHGYSG